MSYPVKLSIVLALMMPLFILPARIRQGQGRDASNLTGSEIVIFFMCLACSLTVFFIFRASFPPYRWMNVILSTCCCGCLSIVFYYSSNFFFEDYPESPLRLMPLGKALPILFYRGVVIAAIVCPVAWFFDAYRREQEQRISMEHLKAENLLARLNSLQQQMDPHFLFNCLNVLRSGTKEDWTKEYTLQLSRIYRYLLTIHQQDHLVAVEDELRFIHSYLHILRERFEDGLRVSVDIRTDTKDRRIPPMALQTLVENAIKHNVVSRAFPLHIRIYNEDDHLVVENTLQRRGDSRDTGGLGVGLANLKERYRLLAGLSPVILRNENSFIVKLPMLHDPGADIGR